MFPFALIGLVIGVGSELLFGNEIKEREESGKKSYKIAKDCYDKKMFFEAAMHLRHATLMNPKNVDAQILLAKTYIRLDSTENLQEILNAISYLDHTKLKEVY